MTSSTVIERIERDLLDDLVGSKEIAIEYGVTTGAVFLWQTRPVGFPQPVKRLSSGPIFRASEVRAWANARNVRKT